MERSQRPGYHVQAVMGWERYKFMPIAVKTMRDIWDKERKGDRPETERSRSFLKIESSCGETSRRRSCQSKKYFLEHLELKKVAMDFFPDYQKYLGEGGFTKI